MNWLVARQLTAAVAGMAMLLFAPIAACLAQEIEGADTSIELVDPHVFRVCADPRNMPLSTQSGEGFENKLAEFFAKKLGEGLAYAWYPGSTGFVRNTLRAHRCDVIMGFPQGDDLAQSTNPYYRTAYALVFKQKQGLDNLESMADPRLKTKRIGIVAGTPPANAMALNGLLGRATSYPLVVDTRVGEIDAGILWGPMAGYYAKKENPPLLVVPLVRETVGPKLAYRMTMAVRPVDQEFKRILNKLIQENQAAINAILLSFGVPLLDEKDQLIKQASTQ
jgi:quinoprotein dehydrogenase-associated probable ABC transporter substrate-binding protein